MLELARHAARLPWHVCIHLLKEVDRVEARGAQALQERRAAVDKRRIVEVER